jgi:glucose uptake protein GlcU
MIRAPRHSTKVRALDAGDAAFRLMGLTVVALVPALFWTSVVALIGAAVGQPPSAATLVTVGAVIATFLFTVIAALISRAA